MSKHHAAIKNDPRWKRARSDCLGRDDHQCIRCGETEGLQADHIIELSIAPELAFEVDNLQTLCQPCHTEKGKAPADVVRSTWLSPRYEYLHDLVFLTGSGKTPAVFDFHNIGEENIPNE